jgi:hypothetical protein
MGHRNVLAAAALDPLVRAWDLRPLPTSYVATYGLADVFLQVRSDDARLLDRLAATLGLPVQADRPALTASVRVDEAAGCGHVRLESERSWDAADLLLGLRSPEFPFEETAGDPGWLCLAFRGQTAPALAFRGAHCVFRLEDRWRTAVALFLFHRLLRMRPEALFFHAATVAVEGRGALIVGPKGSGKSTTALALAARGHALLGDETACYLPADRTVLPMRRPVGIKPGPRARAVAEGITRAGLAPQEDGILRADVTALLPAGAATAVPLRSLVFLRGFAPAPGVAAIEAGREELAALQPLACSLVDASPARRVFEMVRLFEGLRVFRLHPADPDGTAAALEPFL